MGVPVFLSLGIHVEVTLPAVGGTAMVLVEGVAVAEDPSLISIFVLGDGLGGDALR